MEIHIRSSQLRTTKFPQLRSSARPAPQKGFGELSRLLSWRANLFRSKSAFTCSRSLSDRLRLNTSWKDAKLFKITLEEEL